MCFARVSRVSDFYIRGESQRGPHVELLRFYAATHMCKVLVFLSTDTKNQM